VPELAEVGGTTNLITLEVRMTEDCCREPGEEREDDEAREQRDECESAR